MIVIIYSDENANPDEIQENEYEEEMKMTNENVKYFNKFNQYQQFKNNYKAAPYHEKEIVEMNPYETNINKENDDYQFESEYTNQRKPSGNS